MPKLKSSPVLTCDICDFRATNGYIFKRHLHRCFSLHGIASKRSTSRNPIRLKGTEGLLSKDLSYEAMEDSMSGNGLVASDDHVLDEDERTQLVSNFEDSEEQQIDRFSSPQWDMAASSISLLSAPAVFPERRIAAGEVSEIAPGDSCQVMPGAPYCRLYCCYECPYECKSAREYLLHQRSIHSRKMKIYACCVCDYASRYSNKVERHLAVHSRSTTQDRELKVIELTSQPSEPHSTEEHSGLVVSKETTHERPKVQPLKLKRLNIRMPFKISKSYKYKSGSLFASGKQKTIPAMLLSSSPDSTPTFSSGPYKEVFRMVLMEDGSHHFQCRDCLYYAAVPNSVKKHHALCHSRLLRCPHCSLSTTGQAIYYEHLITHQGFGYTKCPECSYVTNAKSNMEKHRSFHNGNYPVHCTVCSFSADSESKIKRHVATQHRPPNATMEEELTVAGDAGGSHQDSSDLEHIMCPAAGSIDATDLDILAQDMIIADEGPNGVPGDGSRLIEYRCPKCPMVCYRRGNFTRHLTAKHKVHQATAASMSKTIEAKACKALKRKRMASSFTALKQMRFQTMENLKCSHCSYIAKWPSDLRRHMQVHTLIKRFKCSMCTNKYKYLGDLNVHMRRDHNTEPPDNIAREVATSDALTKASPAVFRCPICPFTSQSKAELEQHSRQHGNTEKTYQCRQCEYQTYWRGDVSRHLFRHHKIVLSKEATEIWAYFLHRPDIRPLAKQGAGSALSPSPSLEAAKVKASQSLAAAEFSQEKGENLSNTSSQVKKSSPSASTVFLKEGSFVCEYPNCDFKTTISDRMETHLAVHQNLKMFMCPTCGKRTNWKWDVVKHMNKVHMNTSAVIEDVITLTIDEAKASIQDYLTTHEKKSKNLVVSYCSVCNFQSLDRNRVARHLATVHINDSGSVLSVPLTKSESLHNSLNIHIEDGSVSVDNERFSMDWSGQEQPPLKFVEPSPEELALFEKPYACAICRKPGSTKGDVKKHYNYTHPYKDVRIVYVGNETEFNYYTGEIYQKSFTSDQSLDSPDLKTGLPPMSPLGKILRPDSKFSNPKMHGYVKPFKCSICGLRSNWKWDLKKHLRSKHPNEGGFVILLSIEEASETYGRDCTPSHPKNEDYLSVFGSSPSPVHSLTPSHPSPVTTEYVFKQPPNIKAEILVDSPGDDNQEDNFLLPISSQSPTPLVSPAPPASPAPRPRGRESSTSLDPTRRQWMCSACNYISNWRRNMARHIHRKHPEEEDTVQVLALHETAESPVKVASTATMSSTGDDLLQNTPAVEVEASSGRGQGPEKKVNFVQSDMRVWNCSLCAFSSRLRTHIIVHMQQHEMKPFACGICGVPFMNRGPLHRHLQKVHKRSDYLKLCKVNINYDEPDEGHEEDELVKNEYINSYLCRLCSLESLDRGEIEQHLQQMHQMSESDNNILKIQKHVDGSAKRRAALERYSKNHTAQKWNKKIHFCTICPFRTQKKSMLVFHMTYHKPNSVNKFQCKYCPYYVGAVRLLHQHQRKWHKESKSKIRWGQEEHNNSTATATIIHSPAAKPAADVSCSSPLGAARRHCCEKCPYTTNSKNDFIYHKQFHRPKRTAEFKCEYCDYWVVHKRLLKQHMRLHTSMSPTRGPSLEVSPAKSFSSDPGLVYDPLELTELASIKQKMICAKITASLSTSPNISPIKLASQGSEDSKPGYVIKNGLYRKLHKCRFCPYTNIRSRNMQLHQMMHGPRESNYPLMKCPYCDYYVGSKGLLSHHMKVHQKNYGDTPENDAELADMGEEGFENGEDSDQDIPQQQTVDTLLQISRFKRFGCERCPYASAKRQHFVRHLELHGSRQRHTCQYCDYSVPSNNLLLQHTKLHMMPNQNLLASQSITNLQHLSEVPADIALASALPPADSDTAVTISVIHDHLDLYENSIYDSEPKKLYRCDRCPYANVRRDYLLSHLKFHMVPSNLVCPYCDYSAPKQPLLTQHIRVHFCPLPELSDWLLENGETQREINSRQLDLAEALKVAHDYQNKSKKKDKSKLGGMFNLAKMAGKMEEKPEGKENIQKQAAGGVQAKLTYICQYCDREFLTSDKLVKHELQHLIGNHFERREYFSRTTGHQSSVQIVNDGQQHIQQEQSSLMEVCEKKEQNSLKEGSIPADEDAACIGDTSLCDTSTGPLIHGVDITVPVLEKQHPETENNQKVHHSGSLATSSPDTSRGENRHAVQKLASSPSPTDIPVSGGDDDVTVEQGNTHCVVTTSQDLSGTVHSVHVSEEKVRRRKRKKVFKAGNEMNGVSTGLRRSGKASKTDCESADTEHRETDNWNVDSCHTVASDDTEARHNDGHRWGHGNVCEEKLPSVTDTDHCSQTVKPEDDQQMDNIPGALDDHSIQTVKPEDDQQVDNIPGALTDQCSQPVKPEDDKQVGNKPGAFTDHCGQLVKSEDDQEKAANQISGDETECSSEVVKSKAGHQEMIDASQSV